MAEGSTYKEQLDQLAQTIEAGAGQAPIVLGGGARGTLFHPLSFGHHLVQIAKWIERDVETNFARPAGLTFAAFRMMAALELGDSRSPSELADDLSVSRPSVTSSLDTLEGAGLVTRSRHEDGGRKLLIELTPKGRATVKRFLEWLEDQPRAVWFEPLSPQELIILDHLLSKASGALHPVQRRP
ncbi:MarR family winged helix-turn-helix transcriptional regulator [Streptomyces tendae]